MVLNFEMNFALYLNIMSKNFYTTYNLKVCCYIFKLSINLAPQIPFAVSFSSKDLLRTTLKCNSIRAYIIIILWLITLPRLNVFNQGVGISKCDFINICWIRIFVDFFVEFIHLIIKNALKSISYKILNG